MRIIAVESLRDFWARHPTAEQPMRAWVDEVLQAAWKQPADIKAQFGTATILTARRVVFNIKGNDYRVLVAIAYRFGALYIKFVGTHAEYDGIDADSVETRT